MEEGRRRKAEASISGEGAGPQMGILAELRGPLPGGGRPTHHRQGGRGLETPWETLRAGSFEDDPAGNRRKRKSAFLGAGGERQEGGDRGFRVAWGP